MNRQTNTNTQYNESLSMEEKIAITRERIQEEVEKCGHHVYRGHLYVPVVFIDNGHEFAETKAGD